MTEIATASAAELAGLERLAPALVEETGETGWSEVGAELISGGKSNLTFLLSSPAGELVLRRPPTGELLPSAHDMLREARVQSALAGSPVPVPRIVRADAGELIGIRCYLMERVRGHIIRNALPTGYAATAEERERLGFAFIDTLAALHCVDPDQVGLAGYGRPDGYAERQVRRWTRQWESSRSHDVPEVDELADRLRGHVPAQRATSIVHGDYRIDNCVFDLDDPGRINAVLDWELSTLGDPLTDLGYALMFWRHPGEPPISSLTPTVTDQPGFPTRSQLLERYARATGLSLDDLDFHLALAHFKFAVIAQGVATRSREGAMGGQDFGDLDDEILALARAGLDLI
ncbi:phosphotransferase family protein [Nocardioides sp. YIM B13467]|uniref:phosphotransferase family protein n=1 Tax=Nocardioides sp. YIM B13467 TaxID=3366294 RepID=UPI00366EA41E